MIVRFSLISATLLFISSFGQAKTFVKDRGEFPLRYGDYGEFTGEGTNDYSYKITNMAGLRKAMGGGMFPANHNHLLKRDSGYRAWFNNKKRDYNPWDFVHSGDPQKEFYIWTAGKGLTKVQKLFFQAEALAAAGDYAMAIKAYHAVLVHFPREVIWAGDRSFVWYPASVALGRINTLARGNPNLGYVLKGAKFKVINGNDVELENDRFIIHAGRWVKNMPKEPVDLTRLKIINRRGTGKVHLVQYENKHWELRVDNEPFFIRGISYHPTPVGASLAEGQGNLWMFEDNNKNDWPDQPYDAWLDKNGNGKQDGNEPARGDFDFMQEMGVNAIRLYRMENTIKYDPTEFNKKVLRDALHRYGIRFVMGDYLGAYTLGSGAFWEDGTDYKDPEHLRNMETSLRDYVLDHKDEPYVLMWVLGNENLMPSDYSGVNATRTKAARQVKEYLEFVNKMAAMIHDLDPDHPVAIGNLGLLNLDDHAKYAPEVDIFGTNAYLGKWGFGDMWTEVKEEYDRPVLITEYGCDAFDSRINKEDHEGQADYHRGNWKDIHDNRAGGPGEGNSIGGILFEYLDEWWKSYMGSWSEQDKRKDSAMAFPDGWSSEEFLGVMSQGDGKQSPFYRRARKVYYLYRDELWAY